MSLHICNAVSNAAGALVTSHLHRLVTCTDTLKSLLAETLPYASDLLRHSCHYLQRHSCHYLHRNSQVTTCTDTAVCFGLAQTPKSPLAKTHALCCALMMCLL
jgi:hypothetical protein